MNTCNNCGKEFDPIVAKEKFEDSFPIFLYDNLSECLCEECAINGCSDLRIGLLYDDCEECGKRFDVIRDMVRFFEIKHAYLLEEWVAYGNICCECALKDYHPENTYDMEDYSDEFDNDDSEYEGYFDGEMGRDDYE